MSFAAGRLPIIVSRITRAEQQAHSCQQFRRSFAAAHGDAKVNCWEAPTEVARWKEEHIVFAVLGSWAVGIYGSMKIFGGKKPSGQADPKSQAEEVKKVEATLKEAAKH